MIRKGRCHIMVKILHTNELAEAILKVSELQKKSLPKSVIEFDSDIGISVVTPQGAFGVSPTLPDSRAVQYFRNELSKVEVPEEFDDSP